MRWMALFIVALQLGCAGSPSATPPRALSGGSISTGEATLSDAQAESLEEALEITLGQSAGLGQPALNAAGYSQGLLAVSPEMREFVESIDPSLSPNRRFRQILRTLKQRRFELIYDLDTTATAAEAFAERRGNCISFSALMVALAREVGLEAHFNRVLAPMGRRTTSGSGGNALVQNILHINAEVSFGWSTRILEFNFDPRSPYRHKQLADATVQSLYLNNRALELEKGQRREEALDMMQEALTLNPRSSLLWNTLGYIHRRDGNLELAELSYSQALALDRDNTAAQHNLRNVYRLQSRRALSQAELGSDSDAES
ncbi:transglutaminase domain-containing protein [Microbulbifer mangrovi]|uniref:transglutaminase domain-containing protein n=1 Tax=Microbulbifer mangrovi TaxID=927787 RepID=UPI00099045DD|nr:transglutaminase domain-containing protein [Microbulbifer mangrovi]